MPYVRTAGSRWLYSTIQGNNSETICARLRTDRTPKAIPESILLGGCEYLEVSVLI